MQKAILYLAQHQKESDAFLLSLLKGLSAEQLNAPIKSFAGTILGLYLHYFESNNTKLLPILGKITKKESPVFKIKDPTSLAEISAVTSALNEELYNQFAGLTESEFKRKVDLGGPEKVIAAVAISGWQLHATHHRGQISQVLDELGVAHDMFLMKRL